MNPVTPSSSTGAGAADAARSPRLLVVDDDSDLRDLIVELLVEEGYTVDAVTDGAAALALLSRAGQPAPALILLDMHMPVIDGWAFLRAYRELDVPHAPVIALTGVHGSLERYEPIETSAVLSKPFDLDELLELVACFAGSATSAGADGAPPEAAPAEPPTPSGHAPRRAA